MPIGGEKIVNLNAQVAALRKDQAKLTKGIAVLRRILRRMRSHEYGGYMSLRQDGNGWSFVSTGLPQTTPEELDELFAVAGIEPDQVESLGDCWRCKHAKDNGDDRGWSQPCAGCNGVRHNNFVPASRLTMLARFKLPRDVIRQRHREGVLAKLRDPKSAPEET